MAAVVKTMAELAPIMILQANSSTRKNADDNKAEKSSVSYLQNVLRKNGFPNVRVVAPPLYDRGLLIGKN